MIFGWKKDIFISYAYKTDKRYKNLLVAWDKNDLFDFEFYDGSVTVPVNSTQAGPIRRVISQKISQATHLLCIVGEETHKSAWVEWEINKAVETGKKIIAVKTNRSNTTPDALYGVGATWAMSFTFAAIKKAVDES
ncbi:TIR domain-containing protein [Oceanobacter kriegii]|uniref:TIR domain-containing protein n=1 Tax=Oceanobacter kriegii TaxID=64972 RepID=UPI0005686828|nr:TIR domain-containing protein [Oceanobacter kriegii]